MKVVLKMKNSRPEFKVGDKVQTRGENRNCLVVTVDVGQRGDLVRYGVKVASGQRAFRDGSRERLVKESDLEKGWF